MVIADVCRAGYPNPTEGWQEFPYPEYKGLPIVENPEAAYLAH